jgi:hypothetical protein
VWPVGDRLFGVSSKSAPGARAPLAPPKGQHWPQQTKLGNNYKNTKLKLLKTIATIWFNKICKNRQLTPKYINIKVNGNNKNSKQQQQLDLE